MALKLCKECGKQISDHAESCPHCGAKPAKSSGCAIMVIGILVLLGLISLVPSNKPSADQTKYIARDTTPEPPKTWEYESELDKVSGKNQQIARVYSNNSFDLDFPYNGGTYGYLTIRYNPRYGKDLMFSVNKGQLNCQYQNCYISIRFDDGEVIKNYVNEPSDNSNETYFFSNFNKTLNQIKKSKKMYVEATFFQQGSRTFEFNTKNLDTVKLALLK